MAEALLAMGLDWADLIEEDAEMVALLRQALALLPSGDSPLRARLEGFLEAHVMPVALCVEKALLAPDCHQLVGEREAKRACRVAPRGLLPLVHLDSRLDAETAVGFASLRERRTQRLLQ